MTNFAKVKFKDIITIYVSKSEILETEKNVLKDRFAKVSDISINSSSNYPIYASNGYSKAQPKMQISFLKAKTIVGTQSYHSFKPIEGSRQISVRDYSFSQTEKIVKVSR